MTDDNNAVLLAEETPFSPSLNPLHIVNKQGVAAGFDKAARAYNIQATIQHEIAAFGLQKLHELALPFAHNLLDIGCGTANSLATLGTMARQVIGVDISLEMLHQANQRCRSLSATRFIPSNGDAESLPIRSGCIDVVYSSMALQWCQSPQLALGEIHRVLKPNGTALLCILTGDSFGELQEGWRELGLPSRVNQFYKAQTWVDASRSQGLHSSYCTAGFTTWHHSIIGMLQSIKKIGANTKINESAKTKYYITKQEIRGLSHYLRKKQSQQSLLPLHYDMLFLTLTKPC